ncbi:MAG: hypothetical protein F6K22_30695 [Okeania sp. SIO2F4]|uniref:hypothetical protein n=1 Tax=Okeania sp. SIO2F4 TaxID=2607790 RepID=UPI001429F1E1|nr:hypothetical protein [Okeania sp. SIO2F4]NES06803.1 hypothetical protein [Okeania sp. SIO2F4]
MNIKAIALASIIGLSTPAIADITLNSHSASAMPTDFVRPTGAFMDNSENSVVLLKLDEFGNYTYEAKSGRSGAFLTLKNPYIKGNNKRYTYTFKNGNHKYIIAHRPKNPSIIRLSVVNPQGYVILNHLMEKLGTDWDVNSIVGNYENHLYDSGGKNDWHYVTISRIDDNTLQWKNRVGITWTLHATKHREILKVGKDCPYFDHGHTTATVIWDGNQVLGILGPWNKRYDRSN